VGAWMRDGAFDGERVQRCPFTLPGLDVSVCPGYEPLKVSTVDLRLGPTVHGWTTCVYLGAERGRRGYYPGCHHPGGLPLAAPDLARSVAVRRPRKDAARLDTVS
jgi:hypothetical protein